MHALQQALKSEIGRIASGCRATLFHGRDNPIRPEDPDAIVSGVPDVQIDSGRDAFRGRRTRLRLGIDGGELTLLARTRRLPESSEAPPWTYVQWARDRFERRIPVCCIHGGDRTLRMLVQLSSLEIVDPPASAEGVRALADALFARPIRHLLDSAFPPHPTRIGDRVERRVGSLMETCALDTGSSLRADIRMLEHFSRASRLPSRLSSRLDSLRSALAATPPCSTRQFDDEQVRSEVLRLRRLVDSRACSGLRFGTTEIEGLLNPRLFGEIMRLRPLVFQLQLKDPRHPALYFRNPSRPDVEPRPACSGEAGPVLLGMQRKGDLYGMIDLVLNFVETNRVGAIDLDGRSPPRSLMDYLNAIF